MIQKFKTDVCYHKINKNIEEEDYFICFIPSGFKGVWIKVWEHSDYSLGVTYATEEENKELNKIVL
jgi:hypothetical protein